jgi:tetratricopeptide (TPR) repeat protein
VSDEPLDDLEQQLQREQIDRLVLNARVFLRQGRTAEAQAAIDELRTLQPDSAEACELQGDLCRRQGDRKGAREAYQQAFKLDPTNASAERKYAEVVLFLGEQERARREQRELVESPDKRPPKRRSLTLAVVCAFLFPGLGQLYNRHHEKGLALFAASLMIVILLVYGMIIAPWVPHGGRPHQGLDVGEQLEMWLENLRTIPWWHWTLAILGVLGFFGMEAYGVVDAVIVARREAKEADRLGIEVPS